MPPPEALYDTPNPVCTDPILNLPKHSARQQKHHKWKQRKIANAIGERVDIWQFMACWFRNIEVGQSQILLQNDLESGHSIHHQIGTNPNPC